MTRAAGSYFDGLSAKRHPVEVELDERAGRLTFSGAPLEENHIWPLKDLRALSDQARDYTLTLTVRADTDDEAPRDPARLTISEPSMIRQLRELCPALHATDMNKGSWLRIFKRTGLAVGAVLLMIFVILPRMADTLAELIPIEREIAFGKTVMGQIERALGASELGTLGCNNPEGAAALTLMTERMTAGQNLRYELEIHVFDHGMINAFAAPGGQVVLMRGLLENVSGPDAVAAVLAHEIAHVEHRDATRHALRAAGSTGLLSMVLGDFAGGFFVVFLGEQLLQASYTREAEAGADVFALDMLNAAGVDSTGMAEFFDQISEMQEEAFQIPEYLSSHPVSSARADRARRNAKGQREVTPVLNEAEWAALKDICEG